MATNTDNTRQPAPDTDQGAAQQLQDLVNRYQDHAGTFQSFKMLQQLLNGFVAMGGLDGYTREGLQEFFKHFTLISETVFDLETLAAGEVIKNFKALAIKKTS